MYLYIMESSYKNTNSDTKPSHTWETYATHVLRRTPTDHLGGRESPNYVTRQHRRITHQTHDDIVLRSNKQNKTKTYA